jgi:hypothetical protein
MSASVWDTQRLQRMSVHNCQDMGSYYRSLAACFVRARLGVRQQLVFLEVRELPCTATRADSVASPCTPNPAPHRMPLVIGYGHGQLLLSMSSRSLRERLQAAGESAGHRSSSIAASTCTGSAARCPPARSAAAVSGPTPRPPSACASRSTPAGQSHLIYTRKLSLIAGVITEHDPPPCYEAGWRSH